MRLGVLETPRGALSGFDMAQTLAALLDEAASGMSPSEIAVLAAHVRRLRGDGVTILLVEHNMRFVNALAEQLIVLNYGSVIFDGPLAEGIRHPDVVAAYLGRKG